MKKYKKVKQLGTIAGLKEQGKSPALMLREDRDLFIEDNADGQPAVFAGWSIHRKKK